MKITLFPVVLYSLMFTGHTILAAPTVSNVQATQRPGAQLVDIYYDLADATNSTITVGVMVSTNGGASYSLAAPSVGGDVGSGITPGIGKKMTWDAGGDWPGQYSANVRFRVVADDQPPTNSFSLFIDTDGPNAAIDQLSIYITGQGTTFGFAWTNNTSPSQYPNCSTFVWGPSGNNCKGLWPSWDSADVTNPGQLDLVVSTNLTLGTYTFRIICMGDPSNPNPPVPMSATAYLKVISSGVHEF